MEQVLKMKWNNIITYFVYIFTLVHYGLSIIVFDHENKQSYERKQDQVFTILVVNTDIPILGFDTYNLKFVMNWK